MMVEVMVALLISVIGLVGITKLQHVAKNSNAQSVQRTIASNLSNDFIERIRANKAGISTYFSSDNTTLRGTTAAPTQTCISTSKCTASEMASYDIWEWEQKLLGNLEQIDATNQATGGLVNPIVCLQRPAGGGAGIHHIAIAWHSQSKLAFNNTKIPNTNAANCGTAVADGAYDSTGNDNVYRRIHWQEFYLDV